MRLAPIAIILLISLIPIASADPTYNPFEIVRRAVSFGLEDTLKMQGDSLYNLSGTNSTKPQLLPHTLTEPATELFKNPIISRYADMQAWLYQYLFERYLGIGILIIVFNYVKEDWAQNTVGRINFINNNILDMGRFIESVFFGLLIWAFADTGIDALFKLEWFFTSLLMHQTVYIPPPVPLTGIESMLNGASYVFVAGYGIYRYIILGIILSIRYVILILYFFPVVGSAVYGTLVYSVTLLFSRVALIFAAFVGAGISQVSFVTSLFLSYAVLHGMLVVVSILIVLSPIFFSSWFRKSSQMVVALA